jgi:hypothetical protein
MLSDLVSEVRPWGLFIHILLTEDEDEDECGVDLEGLLMTSRNQVNGPPKGVFVHRTGGFSSLQACINTYSIDGACPSDILSTDTSNNLNLTSFSRAQV